MCPVWKRLPWLDCVPGWAPSLRFRGYLVAPDSPVLYSSSSGIGSWKTWEEACPMGVPAAPLKAVAIPQPFSHSAAAAAAVAAAAGRTGQRSIGP